MKDKIKGVVNVLKLMVKYGAYIMAVIGAINYLIDQIEQIKE